MKDPHDKTLHIDNTDDKELEKSEPEFVDEQSAFGANPNPEQITGETTVDREHKMGLEKESSDEGEGWMGSVGSDYITNLDDEE